MFDYHSVSQSVSYEVVLYEFKGLQSFLVLFLSLFSDSCYLIFRRSVSHCFFVSVIYVLYPCVFSLCRRCQFICSCKILICIGIVLVYRFFEVVAGCCNIKLQRRSLVYIDGKRSVNVHICYHYIFAVCILVVCHSVVSLLNPALVAVLCTRHVYKVRYSLVSVGNAVLHTVGINRYVRQTFRINICYCCKS